MSRGGKRAGAGRKPGTKAQATKQALEAVGEGEMPLEYMLRVMRDPTADEKRRDAMATAAAGYIHPKLSSIDMKADVTVSDDTSELTRAQLLDIARAGRKGAAAKGSGAGKPDSVHPVH
jgi:hypothetical protein